MVQAVRADTLAEGDPEHTQTLANLASRITTAAATDAHAIRRVTSLGGLQTYYRDTLRAYADIAPGDGTTTTFLNAGPATAGPHLHQRHGDPQPRRHPRHGPQPARPVPEREDPGGARPVVRADHAET